MTAVCDRVSTAARFDVEQGTQLRVAYIVHGFGVGGIERCVAHLANHLDRGRFQPLVVCLTRSGAAADWIERDDVPILEVNKRAGNDLQAVFRLARLLRENRVDVVHSHNWGTLVETALARRWAGVRCHVHTEHGQGLHERLGGMKRRLRRRATRWAFHRADAVIVCAESVRSLVSDRSGFPESRIQFLPNGVEDPLQQPPTVSTGDLRRQLDIPEDAFVVGSIGRLVDVKDFPTALTATALLQPERIPVHLVLVGDGPNLEALQDHAHQLGLSGRVHLVGWHSNIADWLRLFDVYINCSHSEAMSMGILEAMAAGLPIVATDVGDNRSLVVGADKPCGCMVPVGTAEALADTIGELVSKSDDRRRLAQQSRERYETTFSMALMVRRHENLYGPHAVAASPRPQRAIAG